MIRRAEVAAIARLASTFIANGTAQNEHSSLRPGDAGFADSTRLARTAQQNAQSKDVAQAEPAPAATGHPNVQVTPTDQHRGAVPDERADARAGGRAIATRRQNVRQQLANAWHQISGRQWQLISVVT